MTLTEALPLLIVTLLLLSVGGADVEQMDVTFDGDQRVEGIDDVLVVAGGQTTVPEGASVAGDVYVIGGDVTIAGSLDGDARVLAGNLIVADTATVTGTVQVISGTADVHPGAAVGGVSTLEAPVSGNSPTQRLVGFLLQFLVLALGGLWLVRRHPTALANVGDAITDHPIVSGTIGALAALTLLVLFVYMAFTILLIPVAILGLLGELVIFLYGQLVLGYLLGTTLPVRADVATVAGIAGLLLGMELLGLVPYLGAVVQLGLLVIGFGAVLTTYFGLAHFEPVTIPGGADR